MNARIIAWITRPDMYAHAGSGVPRVRFRMPPSRLNVVLIATFVYVALITPNAASATT
jgi:hypothetical protein